MKIKYAILLMNPAHKFPLAIEPFYFSEHTYFQTASIENMFNSNADIQHWKEWIGTITWDDMYSASEMIVAWQATETPDELNYENYNLENSSFELLRCLPTVTPYCFDFEDFVLHFSGTGEFTGGKVLITDIRTFGRYYSFKRSLYLDSRFKFEDPFFDEFILEKWKKNHTETIEALYNKKLKQVIESLRCFEEAFRCLQLEFKIPNLVRSIECLIDCRRNEDFAEKIIWFIGQPPIDDTFQIHINFAEKLKDLYFLRNDCVHGKEFAWSLKSKLNREVTDADIVPIEFLAEWVSRKVYMRAIENNLSEVFKTRDTLIEAWSDFKNKIPKA